MSLMKGLAIRKPFLLAACLHALVLPVSSQDTGIEGPSFTGAGATPTESKPESKVWFHDGFWWASLWSVSDGAFNIHRLDAGGSVWTDTGVEIDPRPNSHGDVLSDGALLYVGTHEFTTVVGTPGNPIRVQRYGYDGISNTYAPMNAPVVVGDVSTETMVIEKDSADVLWAVWMQGLRVWTSHSTSSDTTWSTATVHPASTTDVRDDDICAIVHFGGNGIGVLWSDQNEDAVFFAIHEDGAPATDWSVEPALEGTGQADDHLNLASATDGRVFAAVKNASNEVLLLERDGGVWNDFLVSDGAEGWTRPIVLLDEEDRTIHVFGMTARRIVEKTTSMDAIAFSDGPGTTVIDDADNVMINNPTSTKQSFDASTGLVVLAAHETTERYWYHYVAPGGGPGPSTSVLCLGDTSAGPCPCGNTTPVGLRQGCINTTSQGMTIELVGSASVSELTLMARNVPIGNTGIFYAGSNLIAPRLLFDGIQCAGGFTMRFRGRMSVDGTVTDTDFPEQNALAPEFLVPGQRVYFQYFSRDNQEGVSPCNGLANLSPALEIELEP